MVYPSEYSFIPGIQGSEKQAIYSIFMAFGALAFVGVGTLVLYWFFGITGYDLIFEAGIVVFVSVLLWSLWQELWWKICVSGRKQRYIKNCTGRSDDR